MVIFSPDRHQAAEQQAVQQAVHVFPLGRDIAALFEGKMRRSFWLANSIRSRHNAVQRAVQSVVQAWQVYVSIAQGR